MGDQKIEVTEVRVRKENCMGRTVFTTQLKETETRKGVTECEARETEVSEQQKPQFK